MTKVIGVRFRPAGKIYFFAPGKLNIKTGDKVIVETARGVEYGSVVVGEKEALNGEVSVRKQGEGDKGTMKFEDFAKILDEEVQNMINKW